MQDNTPAADHTQNGELAEGNASPPGFTTPMDESFVLSTKHYKYWHVDFQKKAIRIVGQDGRVHEDTLGAEFQQENPQIASSTFDWEKWWVLSLTTRGHLVVTEGFNPNSPPPFHDRPSAYLDQNKWRIVTDALRDPSRVKDENERRAARDLIRLASDGGVVLPLSMGHMIETAGLHGERRYEVGLAMAQLASGWQIRNPIDLWNHEAEQTIREHLRIAETATPFYPIVTEPGALFGSDTSLATPVDSPDIDKFMAMLTMPNVILSTLIDPEPTPKHALTRWIDHHASITARIYTEGLPKEQRRRLARRRYWNESIGFYTAAYRHLTNATDFPSFSDRQLIDIFRSSPMVGLISELFVRRFTDHRNKWRRNDLIDMFHLSSAAAYATYVCAETHTGTQLREAQRALGRTETVFTSISDLVTALRRGGARADSERLPDPVRH